MIKHNIELDGKTPGPVDLYVTNYKGNAYKFIYSLQFVVHGVYICEKGDQSLLNPFPHTDNSAADDFEHILSKRKSL